MPIVIYYFQPNIFKYTPQIVNYNWHMKIKLLEFSLH